MQWVEVWATHLRQAGNRQGKLAKASVASRSVSLIRDLGKQNADRKARVLHHAHRVRDACTLFRLPRRGPWRRLLALQLLLLLRMLLFQVLRLLLVLLLNLLFLLAGVPLRSLLIFLFLLLL